MTGQSQAAGGFRRRSRMSNRLRTLRKIGLSLLWVASASGCGRCVPGTGATLATSGRATWVATVGSGDRSVSELDAVGRRMLATLAGFDASTAVGSVTTEDGVRVVIEGPAGLDAQAFAARLSGALGEPVRLERHDDSPATRHFLFADVDRGVIEAQALTIDDIASAVSSEPTRPTTAAALGAVTVALGSDGPLSLSQAAQIRDEARQFRAWTSVLLVRATDVATVQLVLRSVELTLRGRDPALAVRILPRDMPLTEAIIDPQRARARGVDPALGAHAARRMLASRRVLDGVVPIVVRTSALESSQMLTLGIDGPDGLTVALSEIADVTQRAIASPLVRDSSGRAVGFALVGGGDDTLAALESELQLPPGATIEVLARGSVSQGDQALLALCTSSAAAEDLADAPAGPVVPAAVITPSSP